VALVPGGVTLNPDEVDITFSMGERFKLDIPFWASAMDGVVDVDFAIAMGKLGGVAVLNLDGVHTRYEDSRPVIEKIAAADKSTVNAVLKEAYREPVKPKLIAERIKQIKDAGVTCAVSSVPARAEERAGVAQKAGADVFVVQGTVLTARHSSRSYHQLSFEELVRACDIPVVVGNCVHYETALELMETGIAGILVGVGPGAACTTRGVLGVGVPQVTATADVAAARDEHMRRGGMRVAVITDGGMRIGADVCKAFASGADAVMIGTPSPAPRNRRRRASTGAWPLLTRICRAARACTWAREPRSRRSCSAPRAWTMARRTSPGRCARRSACVARATSPSSSTSRW
jgi:IMP dehydrogenase